MADAANSVVETQFQSWEFPMMSISLDDFIAIYYYIIICIQCVREER